VIGPDPTLKMGQLAVPPEIAKNLTIPVQVTNFNYDYCMDLVDKGKVNYVLKDKGVTRINLENALFFKGTRVAHGDVIVRKDEKTEEELEFVVTNGRELLKPGDKLKRNGEWIRDLKYPEKRSYKLNIGDIVERQLQDGDIVLLNRQPTLHEGSMLAQEIVIRPGKTLRFNLSINKSFNADFDFYF
jgi:DNA-directed RNA polymerase beta' subunit